MTSTADRSSVRILRALKTHGPQTAAALAVDVSVTPVAVRQHLDRLAAAGLVASEDHREGVGRPRRYWRLTGSGRQEGFADRHAALAVELLEAVRVLFGTRGLDDLIRQREEAMLARYRERLARVDGLAERVAELARIRDAEGWMTQVQEDGGGGFWLVEHHCPIHEAALAFPGLCRPVPELFAAALGADVRAEPALPGQEGAGRCAYRIGAVPT